MLNNSNDQRKLLPNFDQLFAATAQAPGGVARLRELILTLAVQGKLVAQDANDEPASDLLKRIRAEKSRLIAEGKIKKDKPLAENAEEERPFELPTQWTWVRLIDLMPEFQNGASSRGDAGGTPITVLRLADIKGKRISLAETRQVPIAPTEIAKYHLAEGDILITRVNGSSDIVGQFNLCDRPVDAIYCDHFIRMRINRCWIEPKFCALLGESALVRAAIKSLFITTAGQKTVNQGHIGSLQLPLPPLAEQSRIVARVEELMRLCAALEEKGRLEHTQHQQLLQALLDSLTQTQSAQELARNWQRLAQHFDLLIDRPEAVDALEQTILQLAVRGLLVEQDASDEPASELLRKIRAEKDRLIADGKIKRDKPLPPAIGDEENLFELPNGWSWSRLLDICSISGGATPSKANSRYWIGTIPWVSPKDMKIEKLSDSQDHISEDALKGSLSLIPRGSLLMVVRGMILAHSFPVAENLVPVAINQDMKAATPYFHEVMPFLTLLMAGMKKDVLSRVERSTHGTCKLESPKLFGMSFPLPPLAEQARIVARVTELRALCQQLRDKLTQARHTQTQLAQAWVEQAVT